MSKSSMGAEESGSIALAMPRLMRFNALEERKTPRTGPIDAIFFLMILVYTNTLRVSPADKLDLYVLPVQ